MFNLNKLKPSLVLLILIFNQYKANSQELKHQTDSVLIDTTIRISANFHLETKFIDVLSKRKIKRIETTELIAAYEIENKSEDCFFINNLVGCEYSYCIFYLEVKDSCCNDLKNICICDINPIRYIPILIVANNSHSDTLNFYDCYDFTYSGKYYVRLIFNKWPPEKDYDLREGIDKFRIKSNWTELYIDK